MTQTERSTTVDADVWTAELTLLAARAAQLGLGPRPVAGIAPRDFPRRTFLRTRALHLRGLGYRDVDDLVRLGEQGVPPDRTPPSHAAQLADAVGLVVGANTIYRCDPGLGAWRADDFCGRFVGVVSLVRIDADEIEIGARLLEWNAAHALDAGVALCRHAFALPGVRGLVGFCDAVDVNVPPLFDVLGFAPDGLGVRRGKSVRRFARVKGEWAEAAGALRIAALGEC